MQFSFHVVVRWMVSLSQWLVFRVVHGFSTELVIGGLSESDEGESINSESNLAHLVRSQLPYPLINPHNEIIKM